LKIDSKIYYQKYHKSIVIKFGMKSILDSKIYYQKYHKSIVIKFGMKSILDSKIYYQKYHKSIVIKFGMKSAISPSVILVSGYRQCFWWFLAMTLYFCLSSVLI
jgi:hypothetical protein